MATFEKYKGAEFDVPEVEAFLEQIAASGWTVQSREEPKSYVIVLDEMNRIDVDFQPNTKEWRIVGYQSGSSQSYKLAISLSSFKKLVSQAATSLGMPLDVGPTSVRLSDSTPISNRVGLANLALGATVTAVFDPYFDDQAIASLATLANLGMSLDVNVRILTTSKTWRRLSSPIINGFTTEYHLTLNIRFCATDTEHRRFFLLSSGEVLMIGCSLNSLDKNEAAHVELSNDDVSFFETQWNASAPL